MGGIYLNIRALSKWKYCNIFKKNTNLETWNACSYFLQASAVFGSYVEQLSF